MRAWRTRASTVALPAALAALTALWAGAAALAATAPAPVDDATLRHVLNRVTFGVRAADLDRVRAMGVGRYLEAQLHPEQIPDPAIGRRLAPIETLTMSGEAIGQRFARPLFEARLARRRAPADRNQPQRPDPSMRRLAAQPLSELAEQKVLLAVYSERQLEAVLTDFWFNHFNVDARKGVGRFLLTAYERDAIRPHVLGRFRDLLGATARSPAMLFYLDNWLSADPQQAAARAGRMRGARPGLTGTTADLPAGRARGLNENYARELMELHTLGVDGGYTQQDVTEVARAFTGWTIDRPRQGGATFRFDPRLHAPGEKRVLGQRLIAGGVRDGEQVLDLLSRHPSTARFIAAKLARRFVRDDPPAALIDRAAARFRQTDGNLREVVRIILTSEEFLDPAAAGTKLKSPLEFVASAVRALGADVTDPRALVRLIDGLGMPLYQCQPPTGYKDTAEAWTNAGALVARMNVARQLAQAGPGSGLAGADTLDAAAVGPLSDPTAAVVAKATTDWQRVALTLGSPEFQRR